MPEKTDHGTELTLLGPFFILEAFYHQALISPLKSPIKASGIKRSERGGEL